MDLFFYQSSNGEWHVDISTNQAEMPAILNDYIKGDKYFKIAFPGHNLVRARAQMKLAADMQAKFEDMNRIVAEVAAKVR